MDLVKRKKLDIVVEEHALNRVEMMLSNAGVRGWSVFAGAEGAGQSGHWRQTGVAAAADMRLIIAIVNEQACARALEGLRLYFESYPGIVAVSDVDVLRAERF